MFSVSMRSSLNYFQNEVELISFLLVTGELMNQWSTDSVLRITFCKINNLEKATYSSQQRFCFQGRGFQGIMIFPTCVELIKLDLLFHGVEASKECC